MITCIHCRQSHERGDHQCLRELSLEQVMEIPDAVSDHLLRREYRSLWIRSIFDTRGGDQDFYALAKEMPDLDRHKLVDAISKARVRIEHDMATLPGFHQSYLEEFEAMAAAMVRAYSLRGRVWAHWR